MQPIRIFASALAFATLMLPVLPAHAQDAEAGAAIFKRQCSVCHATVQGKNMVGPSLFGVIGREAGSVPNYSYSQANRNSHIVWIEATLDPYLANPRAVMPNTKMAYAGLKDTKQRADVIAYLATLK